MITEEDHKGVVVLRVRFRRREDAAEHVVGLDAHRVIGGTHQPDLRLRERAIDRLRDRHVRVVRVGARRRVLRVGPRRHVDERLVDRGQPRRVRVERRVRDVERAVEQPRRRRRRRAVEPLDAALDRRPVQLSACGKNFVGVLVRLKKLRRLADVRRPREGRQLIPVIACLGRAGGTPEDVGADVDLAQHGHVVAGVDERVEEGGVHLLARAPRRALRRVVLAGARRVDRAVGRNGGGRCCSRRRGSGRSSGR